MQLNTTNVILTLLGVTLVLCFILTIMDKLHYNNIETFDPVVDAITAQLQNETPDQLKNTIKTLQQRLIDYGYAPNLNNYVTKTSLGPNDGKCLVATADDRDKYISKSDVPAPGPRIDLSQYVKKSSIPPATVCPPAPEIDYSAYVKKSTLPPITKCPPCIAPKVKVSAGLCREPPPCPACPEPKPCPLPICPEPMPCPPQRECPAPLPAVPCPPKICPACPVPPKPTECPKCCDRDVIKVLKKTVYVDKTGNELTAEDQIMSNDVSGSYGKLEPPPTFGSGLATPKPLLKIGTASTSTGGTLNEQSNAGSVNYSNFSLPTEAPFVQSFKIKNTDKTCNPNGFNSEFKQFGVYGNNNNKSMFN